LKQWHAHHATGIPAGGAFQPFGTPSHAVILNFFNQRKLPGRKDVTPGLELRKVFKPWMIHSFPNPQRYTSASQAYIEKANGVFCFATAFVLVHEIAHVHFPHTKKIGTGITTNESVDQEMLADSGQWEKSEKAREISMDATKAYRGIAELVSLLLLSPSLRGADHPDQDERLRDGVLALALPETSNLWMIALVGVRVWEQTYDLPINWP
jgi:hypothetical protein